MNKDKFKVEMLKIFPNISTVFFDKIEKYKLFLQKKNIEFNLTRLCDEKKVYSEYFYESIIPYKNLNLKTEKILDIGSGSGIPGIIIKLLWPNIKLTIIESSNKKTFFLHELCQLLDIDVEIFNKRAEILKNDEYEKFDIVTSRAVAPLAQILEISIPYAKITGIIIEPKSKNYLNEMFGINELIKKMNCKILKIEKFISINNKEHNVIYIKKFNKCPRIYPRKWNLIIKKKL